MTLDQKITASALALSFALLLAYAASPMPEHHIATVKPLPPVTVYDDGRQQFILATSQLFEHQVRNKHIPMPAMQVVQR